MTGMDLNKVSAAASSRREGCMPMMADEERDIIIGKDLRLAIKALRSVPMINWRIEPLTSYNDIRQTSAASDVESVWTSRISTSVNNNNKQSEEQSAKMLKRSPQNPAGWKDSEMLRHDSLTVANARLQLGLMSDKERTFMEGNASSIQLYRLRHSRDLRGEKELQKVVELKSISSTADQPKPTNSMHAHGHQQICGEGQTRSNFVTELSKDETPVNITNMDVYENSLEVLESDELDIDEDVSRCESPENLVERILDLLPAETEADFEFLNEMLDGSTDPKKEIIALSNSRSFETKLSNVKSTKYHSQGSDQMNVLKPTATPDKDNISISNSNVRNGNVSNNDVLPRILLIDGDPKPMEDRNIKPTQLSFESRSTSLSPYLLTSNWMTSSGLYFENNSTTINREPTPEDIFEEIMGSMETPDEDDDLYRPPLAVDGKHFRQEENLEHELKAGDYLLENEWLSLYYDQIRVDEESWLHRVIRKPKMGPPVKPKPIIQKTINKRNDETPHNFNTSAILPVSANSCHHLPDEKTDASSRIELAPVQHEEIRSVTVATTTYNFTSPTFTVVKNSCTPVVIRTSKPDVPAKPRFITSTANRMSNDRTNIIVGEKNSSATNTNKGIKMISIDRPNIISGQTISATLKSSFSDETSTKSDTLVNTAHETSMGVNANIITEDAHESSTVRRAGPRPPVTRVATLPERDTGGDEMDLDLNSEVCHNLDVCTLSDIEGQSLDDLLKRHEDPNLFQPTDERFRPMKNLNSGKANTRSTKVTKLRKVIANRKQRKSKDSNFDDTQMDTLECYGDNGEEGWKSEESPPSGHLDHKIDDCEEQQMDYLEREKVDNNWIKTNEGHKRNYNSSYYRSDLIDQSIKAAKQKMTTSKNEAKHDQSVVIYDTKDDGKAKSTNEIAQNTVQVLSEEVTSQEIILKIVWPKSIGLPPSVKETNTKKPPFRELQLQRVMRLVDLDNDQQRSNNVAIKFKKATGGDTCSAQPMKVPSRSIESSRENYDPKMAAISNKSSFELSDQTAAMKFKSPIEVEFEKQKSSHRLEMISDSTIDVQQTDTIKVFRLPIAAAHKVRNIKDVVATVGRTIIDDSQHHPIKANIRVTCEAVESKSRSSLQDEDVTVIRNTILDTYNPSSVCEDQ